MQSHRQIQRRLATKLHNHSFRFLDVDDVHHVFKRQRLEVETIGSVVIRRDCFRIAVDHDRFEARIAQRKRGMAAAIVKLDSLPDAIRAGTEDHDLAAICGRRFAFSFVRRIEIRRERFKLGAASVHAFVNRNDAQCFSLGANFVFRFFGEIGETPIG